MTFDHLPAIAGIYAIVNRVNGHRYVGQATNVQSRARAHVRDLMKGTHRTSEARLLQKAWDEFGPESFEIVVLEVVENNKKTTSYHERPDNLSLAEHFYINERSEYNADKRIVRDQFIELIAAQAWRAMREG